MSARVIALLQDAGALAIGAGFLESAVRTATPLAFAALGE